MKCSCKILSRSNVFCIVLFFILFFINISFSQVNVNTNQNQNSFNSNITGYLIENKLKENSFEIGAGPLLFGYGLSPIGANISITYVLYLDHILFNRTSNYLFFLLPPIYINSSLLITGDSEFSNKNYYGTIVYNVKGGINYEISTGLKFNLGFIDLTDILINLIFKKDLMNSYIGFGYSFSSYGGIKHNTIEFPYEIEFGSPNSKNQFTIGFKPSIAIPYKVMSNDDLSTYTTTFSEFSVYFKWLINNVF